MNSDKVMDKAEGIFDAILKHLNESNCDHCKKLVKESFEKWK